MSDIDGQLLSTRLQNFAGEAACHNNESAQCEISGDNPWDIGANNVKLFSSSSNLCWAILDDGPGAANIQHLWGTGDGLKIKSKDKIGSKIAGELASATFFEPDKLMYFSRCPDSNLRIHQQLNAQMHEMIKLIKKEDIDLTVANGKMLKGPNKLVKKPESDIDKFDNDNVKYVCELFKNNEYIKNYFNSNDSGMLKVFKYEEGNKNKFNDLLSDIPFILDKFEFITYNTLPIFMTNKSYEYINVDNNYSRLISKESCNKNFILGRKAILEKNSSEFEEQKSFEDNIFGNCGEKILYFWNTIYTYKNKYYNKCKIMNYSEEFLVCEKKNPDAKEESLKRYLGFPANESIKNMICKEEYKVCEFPVMLSFVDKSEAEIQKKLLNESTIEACKQVYLYDPSGRYLNKDKIPIPGIQERSLPNFRLGITANQFIEKKAQKSLISLATSHEIIKKTFEEMIKPILNNFSSQNGNSIVIQNGIDCWEDHKIEVLRSLGAIIAQPHIAQPIQHPVVPQIPPPPTPRSATDVSSSLNKAQTIIELERINLLLPSIKTKGEKKKIITILYNIEREILLNDDILDEKIDELIILITNSENTGYVKNAPSLQYIK